MRILSLLSISVFFSVGCATQPPSENALTLNIIHINDTHSHFDASPASVMQDGEPVYTFIGGHPRILTQAQQLKQRSVQDKIPALFLHGGDAFKGSAYFELFEQRINIDVLNRMHIDAMALGNHEFDIGLAKLSDFIGKVNFPLLAANVDTAEEPALAGSKNIKPYALFVVEQHQLHAIADIAEAKGRELVAVFGLALEDMRAIAPETGALVFHNEIHSAQRTVDMLTAQGVKHIIALTHLGHQRDLAVAAAVNGIDAIVGGHSHSLLGDFRHWGLGQQRPYAELVINPDGQGRTCVVQAGQFAQAIGQAQLSFNNAGQLIRCNGQNTLLASRDYFSSAQRNEQSRFTGSKQQNTEQYVAALPRTAIVAEDASLRQLLDTKYKPAVSRAYGEQIAVAERKINHVRLPGSGGSSNHGSELAGLVADAMVYWLNRSDVRAVSGQNVDFALIGAGNIRSAIEAGNVYEGHVRLDVLPFNTPLSVISISGAQLEKLLTETISATLVPGAHSGKFPYTGKLRYIASEVAAGKAELSQLQFWRDGKWQNIQPEHVYTMATTQYLADGNDGWQVLQQIQQHSSDRRDIILQHGQPAVFSVNKVTATMDSSGATSFSAVYNDIGKLPCDAQGADCKVAARAVIDYLKATPSLLSQPRQPTVTLLR
ncbi:bifunctional metallophosphatase/5'-nucleotidase [Rheinheimera aquimaris]|uniref:bifunctional metallophosphatase/5'-nucleotidase n=1 Tax=Rheinheimera aquimaris TaxID=412437 RepID=UPI001E2F818C|nr:bifunctional metallophosphatase/5'-nucleotidase [Rheinheimera aquimaris]